MDERLSISVPCALSALQSTATAVAAFANAHAIEDRIMFALELAIDEIVSNIIRHGFCNEPTGADIIVSLQAGADRLSILFEDNAPPFNPLEDAPAPDTTSDVEARPIGGLGIHLVKSLSDDAQYQRRGDRNALTLAWNRNAAPNDAPA